MALGPSSFQRGMFGQVWGKLPAGNQAKFDCPLIGISGVRVKRRYSCWKCWGFLQVCQVDSFLIQKCNFLSFDIQQCFCVWGTSLCWTKFLMHLAELCLNGREISTVRKHSMENEAMKTARKSDFVKNQKENVWERRLLCCRGFRPLAFAPNRCHRTLMKTSNRAIALKSRLLLCWITFKEVLVRAKGVDEGDRD